MLNWLFTPDQRRKRLLQRAPEAPLKAFLNVEMPHRNTPLGEVPILALDFETTGLDPRKDHLLSVGHVELHDNRIILATARHCIIHTSKEMKDENISIHHITHDQVAQGLELREIIESLLQTLAGKVLLAHHAAVETGFLQQACQRLYGMAPVFPVIDTLQLAKRRMERIQQPYKSNDLRLFNLRKHYGLPAYQAHNALLDAIAGAELFLALVAHGGYRKPPALKNFLL